MTKRRRQQWNAFMAINLVDAPSPSTKPSHKESGPAVAVAVVSDVGRALIIY
jgi:hypothetical protein